MLRTTRSSIRVKAFVYRWAMMMFRKQDTRRQTPGEDKRRSNAAVAG